MAKIVRLTESDLTRLVKRVIKEQKNNYSGSIIGSQMNFIMETSKKKMLGKIEKIYNPSKTTNQKSPYSQILVVNFGGQGRHEIGFSCQTGKLTGVSLGGDGKVYTDAGLEQRLSENWCK